MTESSIDDLKLLKIDAVLDICAMSHSGLYAQIKAGMFPAPVRIGPRSVAWHARDIRAWLQSRGSTAGDDRDDGAAVRWTP